MLTGHYYINMKRLWLSAVYCLIFTKVARCQTANLSFPENFLIGAATASYQIEGAWNVSGKGENVWDWWTHAYPENIIDGSNGDVACNSYYKYQEDVQWVKDLGLDFYRFSISWSRVLPNGFANEVNEIGLQYYKNLTQELINYNITPIVTIYHWDHPKVLEELGGWTNEMMVEWYADYARVIFEELGPLVKTFITINEPNVFCPGGYNSTSKAPGKILENMGHYLCVHNAIKAHATVYHMYDEEYRPTQGGQIGILQSCPGWVEGDGVTDETIDRLFQFECGWTMHPLYFGDYPEIMKTRIAMISELEGYPFSRLPEFSEEWKQYINGTCDYFGLNHYTSSMPTFDPEEELGTYTIDSGLITLRNETWTTGSSSWLYVVPAGFGNLLRKIRDVYGNPPVFILENGFCDTGELEDYNRIAYFHAYVSEVLTAINEDSCNIVAYTIWSLLDNYEWNSGYTEHYGIISVDFESEDRTRTAKLSTNWWRDVISARALQDVPTNSSRR